MTARPVLRFSASVPKHGNGTGECDDRFSSAGSRFAVADGTSEGGYSDVWAGILADSFCRLETGPGTDGVDAWLDRSRKAWQCWADERSLRDLPWFTRETLRIGAHATFAGLVCPPGAEACAWHAVACGDACVFLVRGGELAVTFPLNDSAAFENSPPLVPASRGARTEALAVASGIARAGDAFYIATDALACWFLASHERGGQPWHVLDRVTIAGDLDRFVAEARHSRALRNDDVTLMSIAVEAGA